MENFRRKNAKLVVSQAVTYRGKKSLKILNKTKTVFENNTSVKTMAVAFNVPSVHEDDEGQWKPANQLGQPNQQPQHQHPHHHHHVGASTNVSQQVRLSAENGQHRLVAAFHQILAAYARHGELSGFCDSCAGCFVEEMVKVWCDKIFMKRCGGQAGGEILMKSGILVDVMENFINHDMK